MMKKKLDHSDNLIAHCCDPPNLLDDPLDIDTFSEEFDLRMRSDHYQILVVTIFFMIAFTSGLVVVLLPRVQRSHDRRFQQRPELPTRLQHNPPFKGLGVLLLTFRFQYQHDYLSHTDAYSFVKLN